MVFVHRIIDSSAALRQVQYLAFQTCDNILVLALLFSVITEHLFVLWIEFICLHLLAALTLLLDWLASIVVFWRLIFWFRLDAW